MARDYEHLARLDEDDALWLSRMISHPLHFTTNTQDCGSKPCSMCSNAARLAVQSLRPRIEKRVVESIQNLYDVHCDRPHPGDG